MIPRPSPTSSPRKAFDVDSTARSLPFGDIVRLGDHHVRISGHLELLVVDGAIRPIRLPTRFRSHFPPNGGLLRATTERPSGVRIGLRTTASQVALRVRTTRLQVDDTLAEVNAFVAVVDGLERSVVVPSVDAAEHLSVLGEDLGTHVVRDHSFVVFDLPAGDKTVDIWLPQMLTVDLFGLDADGPVNPSEPNGRAVWVHHGSSISHCGEPEKPTSSWPVVAAAAAELNVVNLGYAGHCMLDPFVAEAIAAVPANVLSFELGVNIVGARAMDQRTFVPAVHGFLDRIRTGHPGTPIVLVSPLLWPGNEDTAGPTLRTDATDGQHTYSTAGTRADVAGGALSLRLAREHLRHVVRVRANEGEPIWYLDGLQLYGEGDVEAHPMPDGLHPDAALYELIGRRFADLVFGPVGVLEQPAAVGER